MTTNDKASDFVLEWNASSRQVYAFILSLLPNSADADEAFQETGKVLWEKFSEYQSGSSFTSWACRAAFISAMELRRRKRRSPLAFSDTFVEAVECGFPKHVETLSVRHSALIECMEKLTTSDRDLLRRRYVDGGTVATVAAEVGRSIKVVYKELGRIHESLFRCIERTIRQEGA
jgi:RNA polymerase sigma-70 factor, ECF subfamily